MRFHRPGNLTEAYGIAQNRLEAHIEPTVSDRNAPVIHNRTLDFPDWQRLAARAPELQTDQEN